MTETTIGYPLFVPPQIVQDKHIMFSRAALPTIAPKKRFFSSTPSVKTDFTHVVIGAGVVGLAIARQLQSRQGVSTLLIEKHGAVGTETSSRNSEVLLTADWLLCNY